MVKPKVGEHFLAHYSEVGLRMYYVFLFVHERVQNGKKIYLGVKVGKGLEVDFFVPQAWWFDEEGVTIDDASDGAYFRLYGKSKSKRV